MDDIFENLHFLPVIYALLLLAVGYLVAKVLSRFATSRLQVYINPQQTMIMNKLVFYVVLLIFLIMALQQIGFKLSVLLGSAGVVSIAFAFAARTSMANFVSGLFLIIERPFVIGDTITINAITGKVTAIDLMSTKITQADNILVRIPNNTVVSSEIINITYYPIRRVDIKIGLAYDTDLNHLRKVLLNLAAQHELVLKDKQPSVSFTDFADSAITTRFSFWAKRKDCFQLKLDFNEAIKVAFEKENIEIPFPQLSVHKA